MRCVIGTIRDRPHCGEWHPIIQANLCHGGTFHFDGQRLIACGLQSAAQKIRFLDSRHKTVAADGQTTVDPCVGKSPRGFTIINVLKG